MRVSNTRITAPMSRRRSKRPDGGVYRELRKGRPRPMKGRRRTLWIIERVMLVVAVIFIAWAVWHWVF